MIKLVSQISLNQYKWRNDPRIYRWTRQNGLISDAEHAKWEDRIESDPSIKMFGIRSHLDEEIGTVGLTSISNVHGSAEFSLFIAPDYQNKGYGRESLVELLKYGFDHLRLNLVWGETLKDNPARKMFKSIGFVEEGYLRSRYFKNGKYTDSIIFSITKEEYDTRYRN
jgi:RimJ/RimL family protein N-acetyltransferase